MIVRAAGLASFTDSARLTGSAADGHASTPTGPEPSVTARVARSPWISKTSMNFVLDSLLLALMLALLFTAAALRFVFPPPTLADGWSLWGWSYDAWANFQFMLMAVFGLAVLVHVMLHWSWVCCVFAGKVLRSRSARPDEGQQTLWGVGLLIVIVNVLGVLLGLAYLMVEAPLS